MPGLDLCAAGLCRTGCALLPEKRDKAAAAQGRIYFRGGEVTFAASSRNRGATRRWVLRNSLQDGHRRSRAVPTILKPADLLVAFSRRGLRSMHRREKPRDPETRQPGPHRPAADTEIPRPDHGIGAADQIIDRQQSDPAIAHGDT